MATRFIVLRLLYASVVLLIASFLSAFAQSRFVILNSPDVSAFPDVSVQFYALDGAGEGMRNLSPDDFRVQENWIERPVLSISCPPEVPPAPVSAVLSIDISRSMFGGGGPLSRFDLAKEGGRAWVRQMTGRDECAVASFNSASFLNQDFTSDQTALLDALAGLTLLGSTDLDAGLTSWPAGGVTVAARGKNKKIVILLTDGMGTVDVGKTVFRALQSNVEIYAIVLDEPAGNDLKEVALQTGGLCFEGVRTLDDLTALYQLIYRRAQGLEPCRMTWRSEYSCFTHRYVDILSNRYGFSAVTGFAAPILVAGRLVIDPPNLLFDPISPGQTQELTVRFTAEEQPVILESLAFTVPYLSVKEVEENPQFLPKRIAPGEYLDLTFRFAPVDSGFVGGQIDVNTNLCTTDHILYSGGFSPTALRPTIRIAHPNGGEEFEMGVDTVIRWEHVRTTDPVRLEYSIDNGATWNLIAERALGLRHPWTVPATPSNRCLARGRLLNPDSLVNILSHPRSVVDGKFIGDQEVVTLDEGGSLRLWNAATGSLDGEIAVSTFDHQLAVSPDGLYAATGGSVDRYVTVWNLQRGEVKVLLPDAYLNGGTVNPSLKSPLCFTPDGTAILTAKVEKKEDVATYALRLYDLGTGAVRQELRDPEIACRCAVFSPDGSRCAFGGNNGRIRIRDASLAQILQTLNDPNGDVVRLAFSPDGRELISIARSSSGIWTLTRWDPLQGTRIGSLRLPRPVGSVNYNPAAPAYLIADGEGVVRDLMRNEIDREFIGHNGPVNGGYFNSDGSLAMTVSSDMTARVWKIDNEFVRTDLSDSLWAIIPPKISVRDVEFGSVPLGKIRDSILTGYITNEGKRSVTITAMKVIGANWEDFSIMTGHAPFVLAPGELRTVKLAFRPGGLGDRKASLKIEFSGTSLEGRLHGVGIESQLKIVGLVGDFIDFGAVPLGKTRDSLAWGVNTGSTPLEITSLMHGGPDNEQFTILGPDLGIPVIVEPGDSVQVFVRFAPVRLGYAQGGVDVGYDGTGSPTTFGLLGEGISPSDPAISAPSFLEFAPQRCVASSDTMSIRIENPGNAPLTITGATLDGLHPADFLLVPSFTPLSIPPGETRSLQVAFTPTDEGARSARLLLKSNAANAPEYGIDLRGNLERALLSLEEPVIDLGKLCPGESVDLALILRNGGLAPTDAEGAIVEEAGGRIALPSGSVAISGKDSATVNALFTAGDAEGPVSCRVAFLDGLCGSSAAVELRGEIIRPQVSVDSVPEICADEEIVLSAKGGERYEWSPALGLSCADCAAPVAAPSVTTTYRVTGYDADGCFDVDSVTVVVRDRPASVSAMIGRGYRAYPGDTVRVAVELNNAVPELAKTERLEMRLAYDPSAMQVDRDLFFTAGLAGTLLEGWTGGILEAGPGSLHLEFVRGAAPALTDRGVLFYLQCYPFLTKTPGTEVSLEIESGSACLEFLTTAGYVGVDSICGLSYRLIEISLGKYSLGDAAPNPAQGERVSIPFSLGLDGLTRLEIFDAAGNLVEVPINAYLRPGAYQAEWSTGNLGSGIYYYRLTSGDWSRLGRMVVVK